MTDANRADLLLEIGCEELPPKALPALSRALKDGVLAGLRDAGLAFDDSAQGVQLFATPRRLAVLVAQVQTRQQDKQVEKLGPAVSTAYDDDGQPSKAAQGFARSNNVEFDALETVETDKGPRLCYRSNETGQPTAALLPGIVDRAIGQLPIPKRMRWGKSREEFVRPVHWLVLLLDDDIVPCDVLGVQSGRDSQGHRIHAPGPISIGHARDYEPLLEQQGKIIASFERRREHIREQVLEQATTCGGNAVIEDELLDEVCALVEFPVALTGAFDEAFLAVPQEALVYSMSEHQKYFHLVDDKGVLLPRFITVSNIQSNDPAQVIAGNERVIRPRLADAAFFFETDKKVSLEVLRERLKPVVFQQQLGTVFEKTDRIAKLASTVAGMLGADQAAAEQAGQLCKADLASDMVLEFEKMQGIAGGYYARDQKLGESVATAIEQHYLPRFAGDKVPGDTVACAVALADRLDTLSGIFGIGQEPTGSKDPFALRRSAIGLLQIILQNQLALDLPALLQQACRQHAAIEDPGAAAERVLDYIIERLAALYQERGYRSEVFQAVRARSIVDPVDFDARAQAVDAFLQTEESESLAAANKRVKNILDKADSPAPSRVDTALLGEAAEIALHSALDGLAKDAQAAFSQARYREGLLQLTALKAPIDAFFDDVMVNSDDQRLRDNRLALLNELRSLFLSVADISLLAISKK